MLANHAVSTQCGYAYSAGLGGKHEGVEDVERDVVHPVHRVGLEGNDVVDVQGVDPAQVPSG